MRSHECSVHYYVRSRGLTKSGRGCLASRALHCSQHHSTRCPFISGKLPQKLFHHSMILIIENMPLNCVIHTISNLIRFTRNSLQIIHRFRFYESTFIYHLISKMYTVYHRIWDLGKILCCKKYCCNTHL